MAGAGLLCILIAEVVAHSKGGVLSMCFSLSAILACGFADLFVLAFFSGRTNRKGIYIGIGATVLFTAWATLTAGSKPLWEVGALQFPWNDLMIGAIGHVVLLISGYLGNLLFPPEQTATS